MRILIDALSILPGENGGGETYVRGLLNALAEADRDNEYWVVVAPRNRDIFPVRQDNFHLHTVHINNHTRSLRVIYEQLFLPFWGARVKPSLIHFPANMMPLILPWLKIPSVVTIHDLSPMFYRRELPHYYLRWKGRVLAGLYRYAGRHASVVTTGSNFSRRELITHASVPAERIVVASPGGPRGWPVPVNGSSDVALRRYGIVRPYVLTVGRTYKHKNLDSFVVAFSRAKRQFGFPHRLILAGHPGNGHDDVLRAIRAEKAEDFVQISGYVDHADLPNLYGAADLFAMPSLYEGFGFPLLEAMQLGVPTLSSNVCSLPEVGGEAAMYMDPHDIESMVAAVGQVLSDSRLRSRLSERGKVQAARASWRNLATEMLKVYQIAAASKGPGCLSAKFRFQGSEDLK